MSMRPSRQYSFITDKWDIPSGSEMIEALVLITSGDDVSYEIIDIQILKLPYFFRCTSISIYEEYENHQLSKFSLSYLPETMLYALLYGKASAWYFAASKTP